MGGERFAKIKKKKIIEGERRQLVAGVSICI